MNLPNPVPGWLMHNPLLHSFLDDMAEVGAFQWSAYAFVCMLIMMFAGDIFPFAWLVFMIMSANLLVAMAVTMWWERVGRDKYKISSVVDLAEQLGRDT